MSVTAQHAAELQQGAAELGVTLTERQHELLLAYLALLIKWNKAYNLTAVRNPDEMVSRHLLDSLSVVPYVAAGGDTWLRKLGSTHADLTLGSVAAINPSASFGGAVSSLDGLVTTANDGRIALVNETGALTATRNLSANGAGSIDLRTHGVGQAITLDGATLASGSGQVQGQGRSHGRGLMGYPLHE